MTNPTDPLAKFLGEMESAKDGILYDGPEWSTVYKNGYNDAFDSQQNKINKLIRICRIQAEALGKIAFEDDDNNKFTYPEDENQYYIDLAKSRLKQCEAIAAEGVK